MHIEIDRRGEVYCDDVNCMAQRAACEPCVDCPLLKLFREMYVYCNPHVCFDRMCKACGEKMDIMRQMIE